MPYPSAAEYQPYGMGGSVQTGQSFQNLVQPYGEEGGPANLSSKSPYEPYQAPEQSAQANEPFQQFPVPGGYGYPFPAAGGYGFGWWIFFFVLLLIIAGGYYFYSRGFFNRWLY